LRKHSERCDESTWSFDPEAAAEQIPHRLASASLAQGFGMTRFFLVELSLLEENK